MFHIISIDWFNNWKEFVGLKTPEGDIKKVKNPGQINNSDQLRKLCVHNKNGTKEEDQRFLIFCDDLYNNMQLKK